MTYQTPRPPEPSFGAGLAATPPQSINMAKMAMYAGAALSLLNTFLGTPGKAKIKEMALENDSNLKLSDLDSIANVAWWTGLIFGIVGALIWVWMAMANGKGKSWARIVATVLFGLSVISLIMSFTNSGRYTTGVGHALNILTFLAGAAAIFFLWRKDASDFFAARSGK